LGVRGIARDLAAAGSGKFKNLEEKKLKQDGKQSVNVKLKMIKLHVFGSCLITDVKNVESLIG